LVNKGKIAIQNQRCDSENPDASRFCCVCAIIYIAMAYAVIGEKDKAIERLEK
jgi:hypothetical protein